MADEREQARDQALEAERRLLLALTERRVVADGLATRLETWRRSLAMTRWDRSGLGRPSIALPPHSLSLLNLGLVDRLGRVAERRESSEWWPTERFWWERLSPELALLRRRRAGWLAALHARRATQRQSPQPSIDSPAGPDVSTAPAPSAAPEPADLSLAPPFQPASVPPDAGAAPASAEAAPPRASGWTGLGATARAVWQRLSVVLAPQAGTPPPPSAPATVTAATSSAAPPASAALPAASVEGTTSAGETTTVASRSAAEPLASPPPAAPVDTPASSSPAIEEEGQHPSAGEALAEPSGSGVTTAQAVAPGAPLPPTGPREEAPAPESAPAIDSRLSDPLKRAAVDASGDSEPDAATNYGDGTSVPMPAAQPGPEAPASEATMRGEAGRALDVTQAATTGQAAELTAPAPASAASLAGYEPEEWPDALTEAELAGAEQDSSAATWRQPWRWSDAPAGQPAALVAPLALALARRLEADFGVALPARLEQQALAAPARLFWWPTASGRPVRPSRQVRPAWPDARSGVAAATARLPEAPLAEATAPGHAAKETPETLPAATENTASATSAAATAATVVADISAPSPPSRPEWAARVVYEGTYVGRRRPPQRPRAEAARKTPQPRAAATAAALLPPPPPPLPPPDEPGLLGTVLQHQHVVRKRVRARQAMVGRIERAAAWAEQELRHGEQWRIRLPAIAPTPAAEASASAFDPLALVLADRPATPRPRQPGSADAAEPSGHGLETTRPAGSSGGWPTAATSEGRAAAPAPADLPGPSTGAPAGHVAPAEPAAAASGGAASAEPSWLARLFGVFTAHPAHPSRLSAPEHEPATTESSAGQAQAARPEASETSTSEIRQASVAPATPLAARTSARPDQGPSASGSTERTSTLARSSLLGSTSLPDATSAAAYGGQSPQWEGPTVSGDPATVGAAEPRDPRPDQPAASRPQPLLVPGADADTPRFTTAPPSLLRRLLTTVTGPRQPATAPPGPGHDEAAESSTPPGAAQPAAGTREPTADTPTQMPSPATPTPSALAAPARQDDGQALGRAAAPAPVVHAPQSASQAQVSGAAASLSVTDAAVVEPLRGVLAPRISQAMTTVGQAPSSEPFLHRPEAGAHPRLPLHPRSGSPANPATAASTWLPGGRRQAGGHAGAATVPPTAALRVEPGLGAPPTSAPSTTAGPTEPSALAWLFSPLPQGQAAQLSDVIRRLPPPMAAQVLAANVLDSAQPGDSLRPASPPDKRPAGMSPGLPLVLAPLAGQRSSSTGGARQPTSGATPSAHGAVPIVHGLAPAATASARPAGSDAAQSTTATQQHAPAAATPALQRATPAHAPAIVQRTPEREHLPDLAATASAEAAAPEEPDLDALADQVLEILRWRLAAERERALGWR